MHKNSEELGAVDALISVMIVGSGLALTSAAMYAIKLMAA